MSSQQQYPRAGLPAGLAQAQTPGGNATAVQGKQTNTGGHDESSRDVDHAPSSSAAAALRDDKQETVVVRPYPQPQVHGSASTAAPQLAQHLALQPGATASAPTTSNTSAHLPQGVPLAFTEGPGKSTLKTPMPSRVIAPAPVSAQGHLAVSHKVPSHITVTMDSAMPQASGIPVATISGQQGHPGNLHRIMATNVQIIRSGTPALQIGSSAAPQHQFPSHLPRGAAAAAVMSSTKGATVLRPASSPNNATGQPTVQHIIHQPIQSRPIVTTSTPVLPTVVAPVTATRPQSPVISTVTAHSGDIVHGRSALTIHAPAALSIQRPPPARDTPTRITLPSHPAIGAQKPLPHSMAQKPIFSTVTPVAAATVAPILATNAAPSPTTAGSVPQTQISSSNIVAVTMASHSTHATAVTTSTIPVAKVVPQPITHTSPRIQSEFPGERGNLIPISAHRSSPNPITMENRSDNRQSVPVQFQYFLPTYPSAPYPLTHTYTPITSSVSTIRPYPVTAQAPTAAMPAQTSVGVASAVHLNSMQLMTVDRIAQINTQNIQPATVAAQGVQPTAITAQGLHTSTTINPQSIQPAPVNPQQPPTEAKTSVMLPDGSTLVANSINSTFNTSQPAVTVTQPHPQGSGSGGPALVSSPRPSILRKKPASEGAAVRKNLIPTQLGDSGRMDGGLRSTSGSPRPAGVKPKPDILVGLAPPVTAAVEAVSVSGQNAEQQQNSALPPSQIPAQPVSSLLTSATPPSQPVPAAMAVTPPIPSMANVVAPSSHPAATSTAACPVSSTLPEINVKQEAEPMDSSKPVGPAPPSGTPALAVPAAELAPGASPRKKPRKQQHVISTEESEMMEANSTDEERVLTKPPSHRPEKRKSPPKEYIDEEGVRYVPVRIRPPITLLRHYRNPWKAAYHHFQRYSDVRVKEEKKGTLQDVASQKGAVCRAQGWKIHLCAAQLLQLTSLEHDVYSRLTTLQEGLIPKKKSGSDDDLHRISELIQGNMQRCKLVMDQITEAREAMLKVLDHRERVMKLLNKNSSTKKLHKLKRKDRA
ncbi:LOW QUALITY PROTEIN: histone deacetylase complex subunit SAP130b [Colossoma macropomum]|uniref:LOW QUALITY PROTEIN: histone deacetylase complex subunit SAP130b n=1 Tax=Colossoma macropomum TaxID=42526 RepID=UPI00186557E0|nr:LOW QUALITY PROTEIN: histone deacetylase complex subunit SAP130b [Colossoma macropomum]